MFDKRRPYIQLNNPGITEVAFWVDDIEHVYSELLDKNVEFYPVPSFLNLPKIR